jgi:hypothetical protein
MQQAAQQAWLSEFHPSEGAKHPNRSAGLHSGSSRSCGSAAGLPTYTVCSAGEEEGVFDASGCVLYPDCADAAADESANRGSEES